MVCVLYTHLSSLLHIFHTDFSYFLSAVNSSSSDQKRDSKCFDTHCSHLFLWCVFVMLYLLCDISDGTILGLQTYKSIF